MGKETGMYQCPLCSKAIVFRSKDTRLKVCACGSVLNRLESDDLALKPAFIIPDHNDLLQIGATGVWQGRSFEIIGRYRVWLAESVYNYWTILFDDGPAILAEGYGMYAILQRMTPEENITAWDVSRLDIADSVNLAANIPWYLQRRDKAWKYEVEGEVWMPECTDQFTIYDFYARGDHHAEAIEFLNNYIVFYSISFTEFSDLQLTNLNESPVTPKEVNCTECNTTIEVKTFPYAQSCSCPGCGTRFAFRGAGAGFRSLKKDKENDNAASIALGSKGRIRNIDYEVIGYALKEEDNAEAARWKEYVLYNRAEGYAFLSEYGGSWLYARERGNSPVIGSNSPDRIFYKGSEYDLYNRYSIRIVDTAGEFPYDIFDDERKIVSAEFIAPPHMWIYEKSSAEGINWFLAEYQDRKELEQQFPDAAIPAQTEMGVLDPKGRIDPALLIKATLAGIIFLTLVHFLIGATQQQRTVFEGDLQLRDSAASSTFVSPQFSLHKWRSNLRFDITSPVDNNWIDMEAILVNATNGQEYGLQQTVEYYHGVDDGDSWNEGSTHETAFLSSLPSGDYYLRIQASRDTTSAGWDAVKDLTVTVKNDVPMHRNLFIFLGILLVWPVIAYIWYYINERRRWKNSAYSPYNTKNE
ncbi:MAG TPA: DUF4178 domain-containing protein [Puia sp.]|nr:DUF4178 domain-containing protein [Puia sp.]